MPSPPPQPLRVAECGSCGQLFALYATDGVVGCPTCAAAAEVAELEVAPLAVAEPVEAQVETAAPTPEPEPAATIDRPPTVAEWLMRGGDPSVAAGLEPTPAPEPEPPTPAAKPTLSESLGWRAAAAEPEAPTEEPVASGLVSEPTDEFRFDFGATPLDEQSTAADEPTPDDQAPRPASLDWSEAAKPKRRGWLAPLGAVAGLALVAVPAGLLVMDWPPSDAVAASANRDDRRVLPAENDADPAPPNPTPAGEPEPFVAADDEGQPIVDPATQPASFNEPQSTLPPTEPAEETPSDEAPTPDDPFAAAAPPPPVMAAPAGDRYGATTDRYASLPDPIEEPTASMLEPGFETPPAEPEPQPEIGLVGAPTNTAEELTAAVANATPAGAGFATGTLADPEQVSAMGQHYARLCYLAQVLTMLDPAASGPEVMTAELEAGDVFTKLFRTEKPRVESRQIAGPWIAWTGRPHGGVFFAGKPSDVTRRGEVVEYAFEVGDQRVPVVMADRLNPQRFVRTGSTEVGVIGVVVDNPSEWIAGYEGDAERVVWARTALPLRPPVEP